MIDSKYDYYWDDYSNSYDERFWANSKFSLQEPLLNDIDFPDDFKESNYKNYSSNISIRLNFTEKLSSSEEDEVAETDTSTYSGTT